ncbi:MAG: Acetyl-coenzyme A carboxylase carboxyl transferase subunit alpha [Planctomycetes bacterium ADurb.Bin126]|nr:MAG: Acetyl-coenzyme A carboxylase carboxyl transferase subunit alpha [Planctomycetes bacterium ADurb.Bin126]HOD83261.1 acetyl-CoA carboxylase carboxyltransferase subunit alpha [Phycisphaerae bacterium]HQL71819.1 acetyl-CoA carboxylase carboxyltransferase subunit alpha [Phycisphaerae bacterium]
MAKTNSAAEGYVLPFEKPIMHLQRQIAELEASQVQAGRDYSSEIRQLRSQFVSLLKKTYQNLSAWETVQVARHPARPLASDYIETMAKNFVELHGDRRYADDKAIRCGLARVGTEKVVLVAQQKGRDTREKIACNFGCAHPEGYRKALRAMRLGEKFHLPIVCLIDTQGAYPGIGSEERGVAEAIAVNLMEMSRLRTPIVCVVIGEGGSGGALGIGVGDRIAMLEYAFYSVISPEGCAAILWRTGEKAPEAAQAMKMTARDLKALDVIDDIVPEPLGGAHRNPAESAHNLERHIVRTLRELKRIDPEAILKHRYERWRRMGKVIRVEGSPSADQA